MSMDAAKDLVNSGRYNFQPCPGHVSVLVSEAGHVVTVRDGEYVEVKRYNRGVRDLARRVCIDGTFLEVKRLVMAAHGFRGVMPWGNHCEPATRVHACDGNEGNCHIGNLEPWHDVDAARRTHGYGGNDAGRLVPREHVAMMPYTAWVPGHAGQYAVTSWGRVVSYAQREPKFKVRGVSASGTATVHLGRSYSVNKLVWEAFAPLRARGLGRRQLMHLDGDKGNCAIWNLALKTP